MINFSKKNRQNSTYENINNFDTIRCNFERNDKIYITNESYLCKNKIQLRRNPKYKEQEKISFINKVKNNDDWLEDSCNKCFLKRKIEREKETKSINKKLNFFDKNILYEIATNLWDVINVEKENSLDLFNDQIYSNLTKEEKKNFINYVLPHFISYSESISSIKNGFFEKNINLKNKTHKNLSELKRIANENNLCLLINYDKENELTEERQMLITSKKVFFKIIREIIINEKLLDSENNNVILKSILQISENKEKILNTEQNFFSKVSNIDNNSNFHLKKSNDINKIHYRLKNNYPKKKKNNLLLKEDYDVIQNENAINDIIHNSIMELTKNPRTKDSSEKENNTTLLKYKNTTKKIKTYSKKYKKKVHDPLRILKAFLEKDSNILNYKEFFDELRSCTFQPNINKYIEEEKNNLKLKEFEVKEKDNEEEEINMLLKNDSSIINSQLYEYICKTVNDPYNNIKNINIMEYIKSFDMYYNNNMDKNTKNIIKYYNPSHRISRKKFRTFNSCNPNSIKLKEKKKTEIVNCKNAWANGLRGGYKSNYFNFSLNDQNEKEYELKKKHRINQIDWGKRIRLSGRRLKAKVIPNLDLAHEIIENTNTYTEEPPTIIVKKNSSAYNCKNEKNKQSLINKEKGSNTNNFLKEETVFNIPTPIKTYKYNRSLIIKNELNNFSKLTSFVPPKVIAVKSENILEDIKRELLSLPESVYLINKFNIHK
ncbi:conserved Plasmodium protein, unknown function [Plasmodium gallinaceum]|uniref:Uncharacterized protein n=1 Tax=Plasmodium gallinaceum TaxID=5849 RepID=A0A1J1GQG1_PLAGA|nr:conserved Plasmodium protein, unknown function [Plasmodium gallinaceum]CRG94656.1 conserved Plasmodium protein, unknown function [Plasmodium gallinaceum]